MRTPKHASRGQIIVIFGVACVALFAILSLAIDGGRVLMDQRALQNLADGAALTAGADIGPGADATTSATAEDDAVYSIERALSISFSNNYTCPGPAWCAGGQSGILGHRLQGGPCAPWACTPTTAGTNHGPWNASNVASPCCSNWTDSTGAYVLNITTPYSCCGAASEREAFVLVRLAHHMPLLIGGSLWPTIDVSVMTVARNYAIPYAIFMFKHNEDHTITTNGSTSITATKRIGSNGTTSISNTSLTFLCAPAPAYGGDIYNWYPGNASAINAASVREGTCGAPALSRELCLSGAATPCVSPSYLVPPNLHLPADPSTLGVAGCSALLTTTVSTNPVVLAPTQPLDPAWNNCTRYSTVNVQNAGVGYLNPGTYYFEDTSNGSGIQDTGSLVTGDCYPVATNFPACNPAVAIAAGVCGLAGFHCTADRDFGALLVFYPADSSEPNCQNVTNLGGQPFCKLGNSSGSNNALVVSGSGNIHVTSTPKYHNVAIWVDPNLGSSVWNFTNSSQLPASCNTQACAYQLGNGSHVVQVGGGGVIAINGAIFAPDDNLTLSGGAAGSGYGQLLGYTLSMNGGVPVNERYNPLALAYSPVIVQ
jgi:putative Flp pilus-assembly TadE/G-like protein